jgi:hypothetical protein
MHTAILLRARLEFLAATIKFRREGPALTRAEAGADARLVADALGGVRSVLLAIADMYAHA